MDNNELKEMLGLILGEISGLKQGQEELKQEVSGLKQGQEEINKRLEKLERGQVELKQGQAELMRHITNNNVAIGGIFIDALERQDNKVDSIESKVKIIKSKIKIIEKITRDNTYEIALLKAK